MKNVFGIKQDCEEIDGIIFKSRELPTQLEKELEESTEKDYEYLKKIKLSNFLQIIRFITMFLGAIGFGAFFEVLEDKSFNEAMPNILISLLLGIFGLVISVSIIVYEIVKQKKVTKSEDYVKHQEDSLKLLLEAKKTLNIPNDAIEIDTFLSPYVEDNDKIKKVKGLTFDYINFRSFVFIEDDNLCFSDLHYVLSIPLNSFTKIKEINKKYRMFGWNKDEQYNKGIYKQYKIVMDSNSIGTYIVKKLYSIQLNNYFNDFEILIPPYEIDNIRTLINLEVEQEENN